MKYTDRMIREYMSDTAFQSAFRRYCGEMGIRVTNWDGLFAAMGETGREFTWTQRDGAGQVQSFAAGMNATDRDCTWTRRDENGEVVGFIQFTAMDMMSWFFRARCGFIREFWIAPALRRQGHGTQLLRMAEEHLAAQGCAYILLTTDSAPDFYRRHGYTRQKGIAARNEADVFVKALEQ